MSASEPPSSSARSQTLPDPWGPTPPGATELVTQDGVRVIVRPPPPERKRRPERKRPEREVFPRVVIVPPPSPERER